MPPLPRRREKPETIAGLGRHQFAAALRAAGLDVGIAQGENTAGLHRRVVVCSIDTIHARNYVFDDVALFVIDEAHAVAGSEKYRALLFRYWITPAVSSASATRSTTCRWNCATAARTSPAGRSARSLNRSRVRAASS